jgi:hypothetical protein
MICNLCKLPVKDRNVHKTCFDDFRKEYIALRNEYSNFLRAQRNKIVIMDENIIYSYSHRMNITLVENNITKSRYEIRN